MLSALRWNRCPRCTGFRTLTSLPAIASAVVSPDAELVRQAETLVAELYEATLGWAPGLCEAHRAVQAEFGHLKLPFGEGWEDPQSRLSHAVLRDTMTTNGGEAFSERQTAAFEALEEISERTAGIDATTMAGLRLKTLLAFWAAAPMGADQIGDFGYEESHHDAMRQLVHSAAAITGLLPMIEHYEKRCSEVAAQIEAAGGDGRENHCGTQPTDFQRQRARREARRRKLARKAHKLLRAVA